MNQLVLLRTPLNSCGEGEGEKERGKGGSEREGDGRGRVWKGRRERGSEGERLPSLQQVAILQLRSPMS